MKKLLAVFILLMSQTSFALTCSEILSEEKADKILLTRIIEHFNRADIVVKVNYLSSSNYEKVHLYSVDSVWKGEIGTETYLYDDSDNFIHNFRAAPKNKQIVFLQRTEINGPLSIIYELSNFPKDCVETDSTISQVHKPLMNFMVKVQSHN